MVFALWFSSSFSPYVFHPFLPVSFLFPVSFLVRVDKLAMSFLSTAVSLVAAAHIATAFPLWILLCSWLTHGVYAWFFWNWSRFLSIFSVLKIRYSKEAISKLFQKIILTPKIPRYTVAYQGNRISRLSFF